LTRRWLLLAGLALLAALLALSVYWILSHRPGTQRRTQRVRTWLQNPGAQPGWAMQAGTRCVGAPFIFPTDGFVGYLWDDSFRLGHRHQGIDIFGGGLLDQTPVIAAYPGYLTRLPDWKSTVIIRIPADPFQPDRQIWAYYTHMADEQGNSFISSRFPPGTSEVYVEAGTLLGYQGDYSGDPNNPVGVHLHFSLVRDDGKGKFLNELKIQNTLDPSPYLGMQLNARQSDGSVPLCNQ
jgi:peptidoglycan LD-endopeptidase LytH